MTKVMESALTTDSSRSFRQNLMSDMLEEAAEKVRIPGPDDAGQDALHNDAPDVRLGSCKSDVCNIDVVERQAYGEQRGIEAQS